MKNNLDKIFIILAFVVLGASCAIYFLGLSSIDGFSAESQALAQSEGEGELYEKVEVKGVVPESSAAWVLPAAQDNEGKLTFQLFTPPAIWKTLDTGALLSSLPKRVIDVKTEKKVEEKKYAVCEVEFVGFSNATYRISLNGFIGDPANPTFEFKDTQKDIEFSGKKGEPLKYKDPSDISGKTLIDLGLRVVSFERKNVKDSDGIVSSIMMVTLADSSIKKNIRLRTDKPTILNDLRKMKLQASDGEEFLVSKKGESFVYNDSKYTVTDISFDKRYVQLKQVPSDSKILPQEFRLVISAPKAKKTQRAEFQGRDEPSEAQPAKESPKPAVVEKKAVPTIDINAKKRSEELKRRALENEERVREEEAKELAERQRRLG